MAKRKEAPKPEWVEQKVIIKRTHPGVPAADGKSAELIAERHAKKKAYAKVQDGRSYTFITRPKECFLEFRGQKRGPHVTVFWGKLKPGARRRKNCL